MKFFFLHAYTFFTFLGVANRRYLRYLPPDYADGISVPRQRKNGSFLGSPREISVAVHTDEDRPHPHLMVRFETEMKNFKNQLGYRVYTL